MEEHVLPTKYPNSLVFSLYFRSNLITVTHFSSVLFNAGSRISQQVNQTHTHTHITQLSSDISLGEIHKVVWFTPLIWKTSANTVVSFCCIAVRK